MCKFRIMGIMITDRMKDAVRVQELLTKYGCSVKTRLGLHEASETTCSRTGFMMLELVGDPAEWDALEKDLSVIEGMIVKTMTYDCE
jgi:hypothetical protein